MGWFPCIGSTEKKKKKSDRRDPPKPSASTPVAASTSVSASTSRAKGKTKVNPAMTARKDVNLQSNVKRQLKLQTSLNEGPNGSGGGSEHRQAQTFTFHQLQVATKNFNCLLGAGGFGKVYEGNLEGGQAVAVKKLNPDSQQGNKEFLVEVLMLSLFYHPNLVKLIGYCTENNQRLLVYEYMPLGSLDDHLHGCKPNRRSLDWNARMKIAVGAAKGLEYLHDRANPPVIFRDMKSANILLEEGYHAKLSDFGLAKLGPTGDQTHVSTVVMGTHGYCAPEYLMTGQLTTRSDMYSFGVVLLEILTGRVANDSTKPVQEGNLVAWARPQLKNRKNFHRMVDPRLNGLYPSVGLYQVLAIAAMCVQEQASSRPLIGEVVTALSYLASQTYTPRTQSTQSPRAAPSTSTSSPRPRVSNTQIDGSSGSKKS